MFSRWGCGPFDLLKNDYTDEKAKREQVEPGERKVKARLKSLKDTRLALPSDLAVYAMKEYVL